MRLGVVGSGPAGLTAALRLIQQGHDVTLFEQNGHVGGRTASINFGVENGEDHIVDTGAGWLTSFYFRTFSLIKELSIEDKVVLKPRGIRGASQIMIDSTISNKNVHDIPLSPEAIEKSQLFSESDKKSLLMYLKDL